ncbi:MAG: nucleotide exchange factor GrpE [Anaerolineae bacterium]|nr:nucleotide exchange factor GrpE [Anaerolineae bacterium]
MSTRKKIPIRVVQPELKEARPAPAAPVVEAPPPVTNGTDQAPVPPPPSEVAASQAAEMEQLRAELEQWKDRALRLEAEMDNFRKHLQRVTEDRIAADRARLLRDFLDVVDNLARALSANGADAESLRQGVEVTHRSMLHLLNREGVTPIEAEGQPFDPAWHEAVGTVAAQQVGKDPDTVVYVVRQGYRIGDRLLRPARVIVATDSDQPSQE